MNDSGDADVLILGGGVIGLACAHYLLAEGRSVRILDQGRVGGAASWGNCGTLTPSHAAPLAAPGMVGQALRWMLRPDAPLYIRPRWDPALARWLGKVAGRCNTRHWRESGLAKGALLKYSRVLVEDLVFGQDLDCGFEAGGLHYVFRSARALARHRRELPQQFLVLALCPRARCSGSFGGQHCTFRIDATIPVQIVPTCSPQIDSIAVEQSFDHRIGHS